MAIKCPNCLARMSPQKIEHVTVDYCHHCYGVWLDRGELARLQHQKTDLHPESEQALSRRASRAKVWRRKCPYCNMLLQQYRYVQKYPLYIDRCPLCKGIFLDKCEYIQISSLYQESKPQLCHIDGLQDIFEYYNQDCDRELEQGDWWFQFLTALPVEINAPPLRTPWVNYSLIAINVVVFLVYLIQGGAHQSVRQFGLIPNSFLRGDDLYTLITCMFIHGGWMHLIGNMYFLHIMGDNVEDYLGHIGYLFFYLAAGLFANMAFVLLHPDLQHHLIGASGAVSGVIGAYLVACPRAKITCMLLWFQFKLSAYIYLLIWILFQVIGYLMHMRGVAWSAHLAGFTFGLVTFGILKYYYTHRAVSASSDL